MTALFANWVDVSRKSCDLSEFDSQRTEFDWIKGPC